MLGTTSLLFVSSGERGRGQSRYIPFDLRFSVHWPLKGNTWNDSYFKLRIKIWKWKWSSPSNKQPKRFKKNLKKFRLDREWNPDLCDDRTQRSLHYFNLRIQLRLLFLSWNRHLGTLALKFLFNFTTRETMTNLQNTVKRLGTIVFRKCFAADHHSNILELLFFNSCRTPFWPKIWPICTTLSQAFYSPFSASLESLMWNFYLTKLRLIRWPVWKIVTRLRIIVLC